jgi:hypothetical protein
VTRASLAVSISISVQSGDLRRRRQVSRFIIQSSVTRASHFRQDRSIATRAVAVPSRSIQCYTNRHNSIKIIRCDSSLRSSIFQFSVTRESHFFRNRSIAARAVVVPSRSIHCDPSSRSVFFSRSIHCDPSCRSSKIDPLRPELLQCRHNRLIVTRAVAVLSNRSVVFITVEVTRESLSVSSFHFYLLFEVTRAITVSFSVSSIRSDPSRHSTQFNPTRGTQVVTTCQVN